MKEAIDSAVEFLRSAVQTYPQVSEDEPGGYCSEFDMHLADVLNCVLNMQSRLEQAEKDAARYRWLREHGRSNDFRVEQEKRGWMTTHSRTTLDDAIDTAMQSAKESQ